MPSPPDTSRTLNKIFKLSKSFSSNLEVSDDNFLSPSRFMLVFDSPEMKNLSFHCQTISIPSISLPAVEMPFHQLTAQFSGDRVSFEPFTATFLVDEKLKNFNMIFQWIMKQAMETTILKRDLTLLIYSNSNNISHKVRFVGSFPTSLSPVNLATNLGSTNVMASDVSFTYDYYYFELDGNPPF
jgi:hypothetical protein